jgi:hypothetical protein
MEFDPRTQLEGVGQAVFADGITLRDAVFELSRDFVLPNERLVYMKTSPV